MVDRDAEKLESLASSPDIAAIQKKQNKTKGYTQKSKNYSILVFRILSTLGFAWLMLNDSNVTHEIICTMMNANRI